MKPNLKFDANGSFKIVQFTDLHEGPDRDKGIELMNKILKYERPNLVVLTGDNIDGKCKSVDDIKKAINNIARPMEIRNIPWAIVFGNHDDEHKVMTKKEMMQLYMTYEHNISQIGYKTFKRIGNYNLLIKSSKDNIPKFNIFMMDSGKYAPFFIGGYDWIKFTQICWYERTVLKLKRRYKKVIPSLMFFHIPLKKYKEARESGLIDGQRLEDECCAKVNLRLFEKLVKMGDVKGVFVGHDHLNSYSSELKGIKLGYAGYTGYGGYGQDNVPRGARVFLINESNPANFKTWLRREGDKEL
ncbi:MULTISPECIES: metallophosphoesterase family protein [unclassified Clostridium]|uniref:metallophosphoesterase family protein n=1 Tax=unclassified Clostridium TaxID=2614128 RepID=UPI00029837C6|nr:MULTISPECIES: metallophosphoesterase family protein [unclassified Clostridium]EKQ53440.1 MAG: putative phosphohydrolase [Clostridium sp. Maddingley MBC34-26]